MNRDSLIWFSYIFVDILTSFNIMNYANMIIWRHCLDIERVFNETIAKFLNITVLKSSRNAFVSLWWDSAVKWLLYMFSFKESTSKFCKSFAKLWEQGSQRSEASPLVHLKGVPQYMRMLFQSKKIFPLHHLKEKFNVFFSNILGCARIIAFF